MINNRDVLSKSHQEKFLAAKYDYKAQILEILQCL